MLLLQRQEEPTATTYRRLRSDLNFQEAGKEIVSPQGLFCSGIIVSVPSINTMAPVSAATDQGSLAPLAHSTPTLTTYSTVCKAKRTDPIAEYGQASNNCLLRTRQTSVGNCWRFMKPRLVFFAWTRAAAVAHRPETDKLRSTSTYYEYCDGRWIMNLSSLYKSSNM